MISDQFSLEPIFENDQIDPFLADFSDLNSEIIQHLYGFTSLVDEYEK